MDRIELSFEGREMFKQMAREMPRAAARALNRAIKGVRTDASSQIRQKYNVKKKDLDPHMQISPARSTDLVATMSTKGKRIPLAYFAARQTPRGVVVRISKGGPKTILPHTFLVTGKYGPRVMRRVGDQVLVPRLDIAERYTIAISEMLAARNVLTFVMQKGTERLEKEMKHQMEAFTAGHFGARSGKQPT